MTDPYISAQKRIDSGEMTDNREYGEYLNLINASPRRSGMCDFMGSFKCYSFKWSIDNEQNRMDGCTKASK